MSLNWEREDRRRAAARPYDAATGRGTEPLARKWAPPPRNVLARPIELPRMEPIKDAGDPPAAIRNEDGGIE